MNQQILCPHFQSCSGCVIDENVDKIPLFISARDFFSTLGYSLPPLITGPACGWRTRAKLAVRQNMSTGEVAIGLYRAGTHEVESIPDCRVHHPSVNRAVARIKYWIQQNAITIYNEVSFQGELRYLLFAIERATGRVQLTVVVNGVWKHVAERWTTWLQRLMDSDPHLWHSLWFNSQTAHVNAITGPDWHLVAGENWLWDRIGRVEIAFHSSAFAQANLNLFERIVDDLCASVDPKMIVAEYYTGVGVMGLNLAAHGCVVRLNERSPGAEPCFKKSVERLPVAVANRVSFHTGGVDRHLDLIDGADVVLVDPPRKGLDAALMKRFCEARAGLELRYLSCGWDSFRRDCLALLSAGWHLVDAKAYLLFPGTDQLEVLAAFRKKQS